MLISSVLEKTPAEAAWQLCADKLADWVRTSYLEHLNAGARQWEDAMHEDPAALVGLREEGFGHIVGLDYVLKWWGSRDSEELAGQLDVIWKVMEGDSISCYKSWIKLAERDFILGVQKTEAGKREATRAEFREAFAQWRKLFSRLEG